MVLHQIRYKLVIAVVLAFSGLYLLQRGEPVEYLTNQWCLAFGDVYKEIQEIELKYGIEIKYDVAEEAIPELWRNPPSNGTAEPIDRINLCRHIKNLSLELKKYPADILKRDLSTIYLFSRLGFYGVQYGGTSLDSSIYLTGGSKSEGYSDAYFASLLHHEMSSILYRVYQFPKEAWSSINPVEFHYAESDSQVLEAIAKTKKLTIKKRLYREGFLSKYGHSTLENDFNLYAEMAFTHPQQLRSLSEKYPRVRQKAKLTKNFYIGISKNFSIGY